MIDLEAIRQRRLLLAMESSTANRTAALVMGEAGDDIDALLAEVERLQKTEPAWRGGRWWRVLTPAGRLWTETSDEEEAREKAKAEGYRLQRLWVWERLEWRDE